MMRLISAMILILGVAGMLPGLAVASPLAEAENLLRVGNLSEARARLIAMTPTSPAEAERRNWALAVAHMRSGAPQSAVPLLDRLVSARPGDARYRMELGLALWRSGAPGRARYHLDLVRGANGLDPKVRTGIEGVLRQIDRPKLWEGYLSFGIVPETNAVRRTSADSLFIGGDRFQLNPNARAMPATGLQIDGGIAFLPRIGTDLRARFGLRASTRFFEKSVLNDVSVKAEAGVEGTTRSGAQWVVVGTLQRRELGNASYSRGQGLRVGWASRVGRAGHLRLRAEHEVLRHARARLLDGPRSLIAATYSHALASNLMVNGTLYVNRARTKLATEDADGAGVVVGLQYGFAGGLVVDLNLALNRTDRRGVDRIFGIVREDRRSAVSARIKHRELRLGGFAPVFEVGHERQRSTIALNSYRNTHVSLGLSRDF
ncbi:MAG: surface lipoprotein assembly modifier [Gemmobacter sp.]|nr:surface lipoprotein assembly modifier [Gemmobacter sp.]